MRELYQEYEKRNSSLKLKSMTEMSENEIRSAVKGFLVYSLWF